MNKNEKLQKLLKRRYLIELVPISKKDGGGVYACIPELGKDAYIGDGETIIEALINLEKTKIELFSDAIDKGLEIPKPKNYN